MKERITSQDIRRVVTNDISDEALDKWLEKNKDYGEQLFDFDVRAQALELNRKNGKVKDALWYGKPLQFEKLEEVLFDLIGHCFITIARLRLEGNPWEEMPHLETTEEWPCHCGSGELSSWCRCGESGAPDGS